MATKFYKRTLLTKAVYPNAVYSDLYDNNKNTTNIQAGSIAGTPENATFLIGDYVLPSLPSFGHVEMVGAKLGLYINSITQGGSGGSAGLKAFKLGVGIGGTEGGKSTAGSLVNNDDVVQFSSFHDEGHPYIEENFSGGATEDEDLDVVENSVLKYIGPYINEDVGYEKGQNWGGAISWAPSISQETHRKRFGQKQEDGTYIYKLEKEHQWLKNGWKSIKKHGNWWRRNEEWWKHESLAPGLTNDSGIKDDIKYFQEIPIDLLPEDRPTELTTDNSFFDVIKQTETFRSTEDDSGTKREHYNHIIYDTKNVRSGGGSMGLSAKYSHRNNSVTAPLYGTFADPHKIVSGLPTSTDVAESTLQQVAFASKLLPLPIDCGNSQTPQRAAAGTHAPVPTVELDINFQKLAPCFVRNERTDKDTTVSVRKYRLNRSVVITFGELKPDTTDSLYTYAKRHLPLSGSAGTSSTSYGNGKPLQAAFTITCADGDGDIGASEGEQSYIKLTSSDETTFVYVLCDDTTTTKSTGDVLVAGDDTGSIGGGLTAAIAALGTCIAVTVNITGTVVHQAALLNELRTAIEGSSGHNGRILCGATHGASGALTEAHGVQHLHLTQNTGGLAGNTEFVTTLHGGNISFKLSRDTSVSNNGDDTLGHDDGVLDDHDFGFRGGVDSKTFFGSAFVNIDGELCHKALEGAGTATAKDINFQCDDDLGEICFSTAPVAVEGSMNTWLRAAYQLHPDGVGARMCMYEANDGEILQKPHKITNCRSENLNMASSGSYPYTARKASNREQPPKYLTMWLNNYQAVKGASVLKNNWKTGMKHESASNANVTTQALYIDDPATAEKAEGGFVKSQAWQLVKKYTSVRINGDNDASDAPSSSSVTNALAVLTIDKTAPDVNGKLSLTVDDGKNALDDGYFLYDNVNLIDSEIQVGNVDTETSVNIDSLRLKKFNILHHNATPSSNNKFPKRLTIPSSANLIPFNFNLNLKNDKVQNINDFKTYQPNYLSFGFDNWYDMVGSSTAIMTKDAKKLLLNDYQSTLSTTGGNVIVNPNSRFSHVRAGYTSYEARGMQCRNVLNQVVAQPASPGDQDLEAGYWAEVATGTIASPAAREGLNSLSQFFDNNAGVPHFERTGLIVGDNESTLGTNHDISIGTNAAGQIDYFTQKGILEWKFSPRKTDSGADTPVSTQGSTATSLTFSSSTPLAANEYIMIVDEIMKVVSVDTATTVTVLRGQYGTTAVTVPASTNIFNIAVPEKRENIFCSARILHIENHIIQVDSTDVLKLKDGEEFIIYKYGDSHSSPTFTPVIVEVVRFIDEKHAVLNIEPNIAQGSQSVYLISPYRYWLTLEIMNIGGETTKTITAGNTTNDLTLSDIDGLKVYQQIKDTSIYISSISGNIVTLGEHGGDGAYTASDSPTTVTFETGSWQGNNNTHIRKYLPEKSYKNVVGISEKGTYGPTLNESLYNDGANIYSWNLEAFEDSEESAVILEDYGFGDFDTEDGLGGHAGYLPLNIEQDIGKYKEIDISGIISTDSPEFGDTITLIVSTDDPQENFKINIDTETGTNPLYLVTTLEDELIAKPELSVSPDKDNAFFPHFNWKIAEKDVWYGFLIIDSENISNQYKNAIIHYPLNESGSHGTAASTPTEKISGISTLISGPLYNIEGLAGYALDFDGTNDYIKCGTPSGGNFQNNGTNDPTATATTEMSVVAHIVPDAAGSDDRYIIAQEETGGRKFSIKLNSSNQVVARVYDGDASYIELVSSSVIVCDGEMPTNIILTVDTTLTSGNIKLFVNGQKEDQTGLALATGTTNNWQINATMQSANGYVIIGNSSHSDETLDSAFDGKLEEIVVYDKCIYPVIPAVPEFTLTKPISELASGSSIAQSKSHTAKLFIKDYHNIRGKSENEVASTKQVSWRKAAFALDTS